jgi:hypothetical protein
MFHIDESILKQRIKDLREEYLSYQAEVQWLSIRKRSFLKKWLKRLDWRKERLASANRTSIIKE